MKPLILNIKPKDLDIVRNVTLTYLEKNSAIANSISGHLMAYYHILDLIPETVQKVFSGHVFPYSESHIELEISYNLAVVGFYKSSLCSLRSFFELGLLYIYYDRQDNSEEIIKEWLKSQEQTPFKKNIINGLIKIDTVASFNSEKDIINPISNLYSKLCDYVHTRGYFHSHVFLSQSNVVRFNRKSFELWLSYFESSIELLVTLFILKYPIGFQYTPIDAKFGLKAPIGGFLNPSQVDDIKNILDTSTIELLQRISDSDDWAKRTAKEINDMPDISQDKFAQQVIEQDKFWIKQMGFNQWKKNVFDPTYSRIKENQELREYYQIKLTNLANWAKENEYYY